MVWQSVKDIISPMEAGKIAVVVKSEVNIWGNENNVRYKIGKIFRNKQIKTILMSFRQIVTGKNIRLI
jgi:hypothetical protein